MDVRGSKEIIEQVVRSRFSDGSINSIYVSDETDYDGDKVLKITIVFSKAFNSDDREKMLGLVRHIRSELVNVEDNTVFPMVNFISYAEASKIKREFA